VIVPVGVPVVDAVVLLDGEIVGDVVLERLVVIVLVCEGVCDADGVSVIERVVVIVCVVLPLCEAEADCEDVSVAVAE